ncbi:MAG: DJ-1/PfpI family protein [Candidatus Muiribacteriaceae bacterium]
MRICLIFANRLFRDEELKIPMKYMKHNGHEVVFASDSLDRAQGKLGMQITPDILADDIDVNDFDCLALVGGPGTKVFFHDKKLHNILIQADRMHKVIGAICISPVVLAEAGLLKGKNATVWIDGRDSIIEKGAVYKDKPVVVHDNIVTADGPKSAQAYAEALEAVFLRDS